MIDPAPTDKGRSVLYRGTGMGMAERGIISSWNERVVFVRYSGGDTAAATQRSDLFWPEDMPEGTPFVDRTAGYAVERHTCHD
jgi:hypothetical protein